MTLAAAVLFGVSAVVAADVFEAVSPVRVAQFRSVLAALVLGTVAYRRRLLNPQGKLGWTAALGANLALVTVTFYWAIERLGVGPGTTIQFTGPVLVMVWMRLVEKRHVPVIAWLAGVAAIGGTALMSRAWEGQADPVGLAAAATAAVSFASYLIIGEKVGSRLPSLTAVAYAFAFSTVIWLVLVPFSVADLGSGSWARLLFVGLLGTAAPFLLEMAALRRADPGSVGVVATAEPVVGATLAWILLDQVLTAPQIIGGMITAVAVASIHLLTSRRLTLPLPPT